MAHPCAKSQKYFQGESRREIKYMNYRSFNTIILKGKRESPLDFSETVFYYICVIIDVSNENIFMFASSGRSLSSLRARYVCFRGAIVGDVRTSQLREE